MNSNPILFKFDKYLILISMDYLFYYNVIDAMFVRFRMIVAF